MKFIIIISFIDFYSVFSVFVTNTVILLEPCCGTITSGRRNREGQRPNRRACSQAKDPAIAFQNKPLISLVKLVVSIISIILAKWEIAFHSLLSEGRLAFANNNIFSKGGRYCRNFRTVSRHFAAFVSEL